MVPSPFSVNVQKAKRSLWHVNSVCPVGNSVVKLMLSKVTPFWSSRFAELWAFESPGGFSQVASESSPNPVLLQKSKMPPPCSFRLNEKGPSPTGVLPDPPESDSFGSGIESADKLFAKRPASIASANLVIGFIHSPVVSSVPQSVRTNININETWL